MRKPLVSALLVVSLILMWGAEASAFNRINGILIRHGSLIATVFLTGSGAADSLVTVALDVTVEYLCKNPQDKFTDPGTPERQDVTATQSQVLTNDDFDGQGKASVTFVFDFASLQCHQNNFTKVAESELAVGLTLTTAYKKCVGKEPGPDGINDGTACFEFGKTVETTNVIEAVQTTCEAGVRNPDGTVPDQEFICETSVVAHRGGH
jgi:hypothetical protein